MIERTGAIEKLRHEFENSVDTNIDTINGLYEIIDVLIEQIQILQKDVQKLTDVLIYKADSKKNSIEGVSSKTKRELYI